MWTLWGMGITAAGTLLLLLLAYIAQSPRLITRLGLTGARLDLRARILTGYALALFLLSFGFFLAGVPLGPEADDQVLATTPAVADSNDENGAAVVDGVVTTAEPEEQESAAGSDNGTARPASGAFAGLPPSALTATAEVIAASGEEAEEPLLDEEADSTIQPNPTLTSTPTETPSPTPTLTPTPTITPTPTLTPTPILEETAIINIGGSTIWIKRTPGGRDFALVKGGDIVILYPGHANIGGNLWREISTVDGVVGWILESYLSSGEELENGGA
jgi:hypothetical protein